jgi:hypothetical protein
MVFRPCDEYREIPHEQDSNVVATALPCCSSRVIDPS